MILVFDLDDTLYDERSYVMSGFAAVAGMLAPLTDRSESDLVDRMAAIMDELGRGRIFDELLIELSIFEDCLVEECVKTYREHDPQIALPVAHRALLESLGDVPTYVVTDGNPDVQRRKVRALALERHFTDIYYTWSFGQQAAKPSLECFRMISQREQRPLTDIVYVGDDPSKDFISLRAAGALTIRVRTGRFLDVNPEAEYDAEIEISRLTDLPRALGLTPLFDAVRLSSGDDDIRCGRQSRRSWSSHVRYR